MLGKAEEADSKGAAKGIRDLQAENALREIGEGASQPEQQKLCARERSGGVGRDVLCGETEENLEKRLMPTAEAPAEAVPTTEHRQ